MLRPSSTCRDGSRGARPAAYTSGQPRRPLATPRDQPINLLSALLALATGVLHASLTPLLAMGDVRPNLILAAVVAVTALAGLGAGALWAFVGGLSANLLTTDPLGTIPLGLLVVAAIVALLARLVGRSGVAIVITGGLLGSALLDLAAAAVLVLEGTSSPGMGPGSLLTVVGPTAVINAALAVTLYLVGRAALDRMLNRAPTSLG